MKRLAHIIIAALAAVLPGSAWGQNTLLQGGTYQPGHVPMYVGQGSTQPIVQDSGPAGGGDTGLGLSELLLTARGTGTPPYAAQGSGPFGTNFCLYDAPITNPTGFHSLCFSANAQGGALIASGSGGGASDIPLNVSVNGVLFPIGGGGSSSLIVGTSPITSGTNGYFLYNNAGVLGNLNLFATANTWSAAQALTGGATVPTRSAGDNTTNAASTAFVQAAVGAGALTVGTTPITSGTLKGLLYDNGGMLGNLATGTSGVLITDGAGQPSISSTLPSSLTIPSPTFSGTVAGANTVPYSVLAQSAANTMLGNWSGSTANVTANAMAPCADSGGNHLNYVSGTGITCGTAVGAAAAGTLTGATLAANVLNSSLTSVGTLTGGSTGVGFTVALSNSTITGTLPTSVLPAFTGNVTSSAGSAALTIGASQVTNAMLAGSISLTTKVTGALPIANGGTAATTAATALTNLGALPLAGGTMGGALILAADPVAALGAATKQYVDNIASGNQPKASVVAATLVNGTLASAFENGDTIDSVVLATNDRILIKNQSAQAENGIYTVNASGAPTRATDATPWSAIVGASTLVLGGGQASTGWQAQVTAVGTINVTAMPWVQVSANTAYTAGPGVSLSGVNFFLDTGSVTNAMLAGSIAASKLIGSDIATVGTIATGTWHGTAIGSQYGGTGQDWSASSGIPLITAGTASLLSSTGSGNVVRATTPSISALTVTSSFSATGLVTNVDLVNSAVTLGATALTLGATVLDFTMTNNHVIKWKDSGGSDVNALYLDGGNRFQLGGGDNVAISATQGSTSSSTGALQVAGGIYAGAASILNGTLTLTAATAPELIFAPASGSTVHGGIVQFGDTVFFQSVGVGNQMFWNVATGTFSFGANVGIGTTTPTGFGGNTLAVSTASTGGSTVRLTDSAIANADWAFLASTGGSVPLFRIYNATQGLDRFVIDATGSAGFGTQNPTTALESTGQGIAIGNNASTHVGTIFVNPYVDSNNTTSGLVVKLNDQDVTATYGNTGYEYALIGTIKSTNNNKQTATNGTTAAGNNTLHFASTPSGITGLLVSDITTGQSAAIPAGTTIISVTGTTAVMSANAVSPTVQNGDVIQFGLSPNKVGTMGSGVASGATSGNVWGGYFECGLEASSNIYSFCIGTEIDVNNFSVDKGTDLAHPAYGLQITGASTFRSTAALLLAGTTDQWANGIVFANMRAFTTTYGIDLAFDTSNSFGSSAIRLPNNQTIAWIRAGTGTDLNGMYLDNFDVFQIGGGLAVNIPSTLNVASGYISNGSNGVSCPSGINATTFRSVNGIVTAC